MMRRGDERGQAVPLALAVVALAILAMAALAELGGNVVDAGRARTAADAAALAGVEGGREASARVAADNGAVLVSWSERGRRRRATGHRDRAGRAGHGDRSSHESGTVTPRTCPGDGGSAAYTRCHAQLRPLRCHAPVEPVPRLAHGSGRNGDVEARTS